MEYFTPANLNMSNIITLDHRTYQNIKKQFPYNITRITHNVLDYHRGNLLLPVCVLPNFLTSSVYLLLIFQNKVKYIHLPQRFQKK